MTAVLEGINKGQDTYTAQRTLLDEQQDKIDELHARLRRQRAVALPVNLGPAD